MTPLIEEEIARCEAPRNGSGPLWAYGSPPIARRDRAGILFATVPETSRSVKPLCNTRMRLFMRRLEGHWGPVFESPEFDEREPCPVALLPGGRVLVSINPRIAPFRAEPDGSAIMSYCSPHLLVFDAARPRDYPRLITPQWDVPWPFTDHSYRGVAVDPARGELLLLHIEGNLWTAPDAGCYHWCLVDAEGRTAANGALAFPVRGCYPAVVLRDRCAYVLAVSDIVEPNPEWAACKRKVLGQKWDYDFRRLFLARSTDIAGRGFDPPLVIDDVDATAGFIRHLDMIMDESGDLHILYLRRNVWKSFLRDTFFPGLPLEIALCYVRVSAGAVTERRTMMACREDPAGWLVNPAGPLGPWGRGEQIQTRDPIPLCAGLHLGVEGQVTVLVSRAAVDPDRPQDSGMFLVTLDGCARRAYAQKRLDLFQTISARNGSITLPDAVDVIGSCSEKPDAVRFASIPLQ